MLEEKHIHAKPICCFAWIDNYYSNQHFSFLNCQVSYFTPFYFLCLKLMISFPYITSCFWLLSLSCLVLKEKKCT